MLVNYAMGRFAGEACRWRTVDLVVLAALINLFFLFQVARKSGRTDA